MSRMFRLLVAFILIISLLPSSAYASDSVEASSEPITLQQTMDNSSATAPAVSISTLEAQSVLLENTPILFTANEAPQEVPKVSAAASPTIATVPDLPAVGDILVSAIKVTSNKNIDVIELRNTTKKPVNVSNWHVDVARYNATDEDICRLALSGYILAGRAVTFGNSVESNANDAIYPFSDCLPAAFAVSDVTVRVYQSNVLVEEVRPGTSIGLFERRGFTDTYRKGVFTTDFKSMTRVFTTSQLYIPKQTTPIQIVEINANPNPCTPGDEHLACYDYVKLHNPSDQLVILNELRLRFGQITQSSTTSNTYSLAGTLLPGETKVITHSADGSRLSIPNVSGTGWLQDAVGLIDYSSGVTPYEKGDMVATSGKSWAYDVTDGIWKWGIASPYGDNVFITEAAVMGDSSATNSALKPCREDQYRSEETNRCRNISSTAGLTPCKEGQYRSEETNRCRSIAGSTSTLKPCREDQYRSEETNRCRNITAASANLKPCKDNQYRSEETNRCRNIVAVSAPATAFAVEPVEEGAKVFIGWWVLGGILIAAFSYAGWEWRREIVMVGRKVFTLRLFK